MGPFWFCYNPQDAVTREELKGIIKDFKPIAQVVIISGRDSDA